MAFSTEYFNNENNVCEVKVFTKKKKSFDCLRMLAFYMRAWPNLGFGISVSVRY